MAEPTTRPARETPPGETVAQVVTRGSPEEVRLSREMSLTDATLLGVGALMGGGVFVLVGIAAGAAGPAVALAFALNALICIPTLLIYAELGSAFDDAGGGYLWVKEAMGPLAGFMSGWVGWFSHAIACAVYTLACASYATVLLAQAGVTAAPFSGFALKLVAVAFTGAFLALNYIGVKSSVKTENAITVVVLAIIAAFVAFGVRAAMQNPDAAVANFTDFMPFGVNGLVVAMGLTFLAFEGFEIISQSSEEVKNPRRNIPRAIKLSLLIVAPIYVLVTLVALAATFPAGGEASWAFLGERGELALVRAADAFMPYGFVVLTGCALLTNMTALNATIYSSSRVSFAMGRDRNLPDAFGRIHPKRRTPHLSIWMSGIIVTAIAIALPIEQVAAAAEIMFLLLFLLVNVSYIKLRNTVPAHRFGYRAPWFPVLPILGIVVQFFLAAVLLGHALKAALVTLAALALGFLVFFAYVHPRERKARAIKAAHTIIHRKEDVQHKDFRILVPLANPANVIPLAKCARAIAKALDGEIHFLYIVEMPEVTPLSEGRAFVHKAQPLLAEAERAVNGEVPVHTLVRIGHSVPTTIHDTAIEKGATLLLVGWRGVRRFREFALGSTLQDVVENPPCDVAVLKIRDNDPPERILIPTHGGAHAPLSLRLGTAIAKTDRANVTLYNVIPPEEEGITHEGRRARARGLIAAYGVPGVDVRLDIEHARDVVGRVTEKARGYDLVLVGASTEPVWRNYLFGHKTEQLADRIGATVLMVKAHQGTAAFGMRLLARRLHGWRHYLNAGK